MKYPAYQINIPSAVRFDKSLPANAKLLYGDIKALCDQQGYCWASNQFLSELYAVEKKAVSRWIHQLQKQNYIYVEIDKSKGNQRKIYMIDYSSLEDKVSSPKGQVREVSEDRYPFEKTSEKPLHLINNIIDYNDRIHRISSQKGIVNLRNKDGSFAETKHGKGSEKLPSPHVATSPPPDQRPHPMTKLIKPGVKEVEEYMKEQKDLCPDSLTARGQALRFVNYYEANGWKVGRNHMQDWKAAANNWLLNTIDYQTSKSKPHDRLHSGGSKDYSIPL